MALTNDAIQGVPPLYRQRWTGDKNKLTRLASRAMAEALWKLVVGFDGDSDCVEQTLHQKDCLVGKKLCF